MTIIRVSRHTLIEHSLPAATRVIGLWLFALLGLLLAACGGSDGPTGPSPVPAGQSAQGTLGAAGGSVVLTSSDGAVFSLSVPAGALTKNTTIVLSTATATSAQHFNLQFEPKGLVLDGGLSATLTVTLRADAPLPAKGGLLYDAVPTAFTRLADGRLQVQLSHFAGTPPASASARAQSQSVHALAAPSTATCSPQLGGSDGSLTADDAVEIELYGQCMVAAVNALAANAQYAAAVRLASATAAYLQAAGVGDPGGFINQASSIACIAYRDALDTARSTPVTTMGTLYTVLKPMLFWEGVRQSLGATCTGVGATDFMDVTNTKTSEAAAFYAAQKPTLTDTTSPQYTAAAGEASAAHDTVAQVRSLQPSPAVQTVLTTQIEQRAEPSLLDAMLQAPWQRCRDSGDYSELMRLMDLMNQPQAVKDAAQYCATQFSAQARDNTGAVTATLAPALGGITAAQRITTGALAVSRDGKLSLTGPIGALQCPTDSGGGTESLLIKLDGTTVQTIAVAPYLQTRLDIAIQAALTAAGVADTAAQTTLTVERSGQPCDGYWGTSPAPLLSLSLNLGICTPAGTDAFCITPIEVADVNLYRPLGFNNSGEVLFSHSYNTDAQNIACQFSDNPPALPCGAVWRSGTLRDLPNRFVPRGIADDGTVGGNLIEGTTYYTSLSYPTVVPRGASAGIRLTSSSVAATGMYLMSMSAGGRAIYQVAGTGGSVFASTGPAWGPGSLLASGRFSPTGTDTLDYSIRFDGDAAGIVGQMLVGSQSYAMKDFSPGGPGVANVYIDARGTVLYDVADGSDIWGLTPSSVAIPAGWKPRVLGRNGDVVLCGVPGDTGVRPIKGTINLYSNAAAVPVSSNFSLTQGGATYNVQADSLCNDSLFPGRYIDDKGRLLTDASSDTRPNVRAAILTPRGVALP